MAEGWTAEDIPDQSGRIAIVTGANSGLGLVTARELARSGARVVLACRNLDKGHEAVDQIRAAVPDAQVQLDELDLASLESVRGFAERFKATHDGLDLLINNAGVMAPPRRRTVDGFELQFGTNHLGHFLLTNLLLDSMEGREDARVVTLSSTAHKMGRISFDNLDGDRYYFRWRAYGQSKLANLLFALELDRRLRSRGSTVKSLAAHPGYAATNLQTASPPLIGRAEELRSLRARWRHACAGAGGLVTLVGAYGMGKTRLAAELAAVADRDGALVLYAAGTGAPEAALAMLGRARDARRAVLVVVDDADRAPAEVRATL